MQVTNEEDSCLQEFDRLDAEYEREYLRYKQMTDPNEIHKQIDLLKRLNQERNAAIQKFPCD